jgi:hypothetical protein
MAICLCSTEPPWSSTRGGRQARGPREGHAGVDPGPASPLHLRLLETRRAAAFEDVRAQPVRRISLHLQISSLDGKSKVPMA